MFQHSHHAQFISIAPTLWVELQKIILKNCKTKSVFAAYFLACIFFNENCLKSASDKNGKALITVTRSHTHTHDFCAALLIRRKREKTQLKQSYWSRASWSLLHHRSNWCCWCSLVCVAKVWQPKRSCHPNTKRKLIGKSSWSWKVEANSVTATADHWKSKPLTFIIVTNVEHTQADQRPIDANACSANAWCCLTCTRLYQSAPALVMCYN